jgi:hypothetical protein
VRQGVQERRFARLPRRVDNEVLLIFYQMPDIFIQMPEGIHHIVILRVAESGGIEETFHGAKIGVFGVGASGVFFCIWKKNGVWVTFCFLGGYMGSWLV